MSDPSKHAERQATEDLLAGFDRPGRSPRAPAVRPQLDFADRAPLAGGDTVLVTRKQSAMLWPWVIAAFVGSVGLGLLLFVVILRRRGVEPGPELAEPAAVSAAPSASISAPASAQPPPTITSATASTSPPTGPRRPPPAPKKPEHRGDYINDL